MEIGGKKVYDVRLIFRKTGDGSKIVNVTIRSTKKGPLIRATLPFKGYVYDDNHNYWTSYNGQQISVYHRRERHIYVNEQQHSIIPPDIGQKLEGLVLNVLNTPNQ